MKKILVVGQLGYHENTVVLPILEQLEKHFHIDRIGSTLDFFIPRIYEEMRDNYCNSVIQFSELKNYSAVFFVDYWNPLIPLYKIGSHFYNPELKFIGLSHGSYKIEGDVANDIKTGDIFEDYLNKVYDLVIVPREFLMRLYGSPDNMKVCSFPMGIATNKTPNFKFKRRVIYAHRFDYDKGNDIFLEFVNFCKNCNTEDIEFIVIGNIDQENLDILHSANIKHLGYMTFNEQEDLCADGGYAWSSARSETISYTVWLLVSFGLTPLINEHPAYESFPDRFKYDSNAKDFAKALQIINSESVMTNDEWEILKSTEDGTSEKICETIKNLIYV